MTKLRAAAPPRWAEWAAWGTVASVLPSGIWRILVGLGVDLGWSDDQLRSQDMPGGGTVYVVGLTLASVAGAALTFGLVRSWGEVLPMWLPVMGGRRVPPSLAFGLAVTGAVVVLTIVAMSIVNWGQVSGFEDDPDSGWARLMIATYAPAALWPLLLLAVTADFWRRHHSTHLIRSHPFERHPYRTKQATTRDNGTDGAGSAGPFRSR